MKLTDLKLLVDVVYDDTVEGIFVGHGFAAAKGRLRRLDLVEQDPNSPNMVRATDKGRSIVEVILNLCGGLAGC